MGNSVIKKQNSFGTWISISSGFEAPNDGFVKVLVNPTQSGAYVTLSIGGNSFVVSTGGYSNTVSYPIAKGQTIVVTGSLGASVSLEYMHS
jgi:hypothetical protein